MTTLKLFVRSLPAAALAALFLAGCAEDPRSVEAEDVEEVEESISKEDLVGRWSFVYDDARRATYEAELAKEIEDPAALAKAKVDAEEEAKASEIEFTEDGVYISRIAGKEIFRAPPMVVDRIEGRTLYTTVSDGKTVALTLLDDDTLVVTDPRKGDLRFTRAR
jgi:hypothetical protein